MTHPSSPPAPMTARLRELMEKATEGEYSPQNMVALQIFMGFNAPTILRLLEAVEGAEKALAYCEREMVARLRHGLASVPMGAQQISDVVDANPAIVKIREALATLRAAREGAR